MDTKTNPIHTLSTRDPLRPSDTSRMKVRERKKIFHPNGNETRLEYQYSYQTIQSLKKKLLQETIRKLLNDENISPRRRYNACKYLCTQYRSSSINKGNANSHKKGEFTVTRWVLALPPYLHQLRQNIYKEKEALNDTLNHRVFIVVYRLSHLKLAEYTSFSSAHRVFSRIYCT